MYELLQSNVLVLTSQAPLLIKILGSRVRLAGRALFALGMLIKHPPHRAAIARMKGMTHLSQWLQTALEKEVASGAELQLT